MPSDNPVLEVLCSAPFMKITDLNGCYHFVVEQAEKASWDAAEAACQAQDPRAHLVSFESKELNLHSTKQRVWCVMFSLMFESIYWINPDYSIWLWLFNIRKSNMTILHIGTANLSWIHEVGTLFLLFLDRWEGQRWRRSADMDR